MFLQYYTCSDACYKFESVIMKIVCYHIEMTKIIISTVYPLLSVVLTMVVGYPVVIGLAQPDRINTKRTSSRQHSLLRSQVRRGVFDRVEIQDVSDV